MTKPITTGPITEQELYVWLLTQRLLGEAGELDTGTGSNTWTTSFRGGHSR